MWTNSFYICQLLINLKRVSMSLPFRGQLITDTYTSKFVHLLIILFPVCAHAAINYKKGSIIVVFHFCNKLRHTYKQEMEKLTCGPTSFYICQLLINLKRVSTYLPFRGLLITDTYTRKFVHMLIIPFPVCAYAAINYENGRRL